MCNPINPISLKVEIRDEIPNCVRIEAEYENHEEEDNPWITVISMPHDKALFVADAIYRAMNTLRREGKFCGEG